MRTFVSANGLPFIHLLPRRFAADAEMRGAPEQRFHEPVAFLNFGVAAGRLARAPAALRLVFRLESRQKIPHQRAQGLPPPGGFHPRRVIDLFTHGDCDILHGFTVSVRLWGVNRRSSEIDPSTAEPGEPGWRCRVLGVERTYSEPPKSWT